ncbi:MAG: GGDEF domain-containing protein [Thiohalomonadales bacterium]
MSLSNKKIILSALFAITLILLTNHFSSLIPKFPDFIVSIIHILPYFLILFIIAISLKHNLSRELNLALSFIIVYWILKNLIWPTNTNDATATILFVIIGPMLAINFLFIIRTPEKGIFNKNGLHHLYLILFEIAVLIWFVNYTPELLLKYLYYPYFVSPIFDATAMYQSTIIINSIVFIILLINALMKQKVEMTGFLGAFISIVLAQHFINSPSTSMMFFTVACLILILTIGLNNFSLSKIDQLTNLPSYRSFKNQLNTLHDRYCIAIVDIDEFKELTDEYGQDICDQILCMIASRSLRLGRKGFPYRYRNEEFALIFYDMNLHEANKYLATLCDSIANEPFLIRSKKRPFFKPNSKTAQPAGKIISKPIPISVSVGIAEKQAHHQNPSEVLTTAHEALARVKEQQQYFATI